MNPPVTEIFCITHSRVSNIISYRSWYLEDPFLNLTHTMGTLQLMNKTESHFFLSRGAAIHLF